MRKRTKETLAAILLPVGLPMTITAPLWVNPRWLGWSITAVGWAGYLWFALGSVMLWREMIRRSVAKRPWILGGSPDPPSPANADEPSS